ncbi:Serine protease family s33, partial [Globisporangium polare]
MRAVSVLASTASSSASRALRRQAASVLITSSRHATVATKASLGFPRLRSLSTANTSSRADDSSRSARTTTRPPRPELPEPQFVEVDGKCVLKYV